jgi:alpha-D-ribose 1-methylphosphonate 5-phosphate C-P lyase
MSVKETLVRQLAMPKLGVSPKTFSIPAVSLHTDSREVPIGNGHGTEKRTSQRPFLIGRDIPAEEATGKQMRCRKCGKRLLIDRVLIDHEGEEVWVRSDLKCPEHGLRSTQRLGNEGKPVQEYHKPSRKRITF